jgi:hypothetical protein
MGHERMIRSEVETAIAKALAALLLCFNYFEETCNFANFKLESATDLPPLTWTKEHQAATTEPS